MCTKPIASVLATLIVEAPQAVCECCNACIDAKRVSFIRSERCISTLITPLTGVRALLYVQLSIIPNLLQVLPILSGGCQDFVRGKQTLYFPYCLK